MKNLLETIDFRKTYEVGKVDVQALRGVSLRVREGELTAIMGPSGCGKSSMMYILGAMRKPTAGKVLIEGSDIAKMGDRELTRIRRKKVGHYLVSCDLLMKLQAVKLSISLSIPTSKT